MNKNFQKHYVILFFLIFIQITLSQKLYAATKTSTSGGNWNSTGTWVGGAIPVGGDSVIINTTGTVVINISPPSLSYLSITNGTLQFIKNAANNVVVTGDVAVSSGKTFSVENSGSGGTNTLTIGRNFINNGSVSFLPAAGKVCNVTFNMNGSPSISGSGTTSFSNITLNMGTSKSNVLDVQSVITMAVATSPNTLTLTNGTFKLSSASSITPFGGSSTIIPATAGFVLNNASAVSNWGSAGSPTVSGDLIITSGTMTVGTGNNALIISGTGVYNQSGGTMNVKGRLECIASGASFTLSNGSFNIPSGGTVSTSSNSIFQIGNLPTTFSITGGTTTIASANANTTLADININRSGTPITGGTFIVSNATITVNNNIPFFNFTVQNGGGTAIAKLITNNLKITNNLTISSGTLDAASNNKDITVGGNWSNTGIFSSGTATVSFNSTTSGKTLSGTLIGSSQFYKATFDGIGGSWSFLNPADIANDFTITNGSVTAPAGSLKVGGNWSNSSTFTHNNGTVIFNSTTADQILGGTVTTQIFNHVTIIKSTKKLSIGGSTTLATIAGTFTMTSGNVDCGTNTLELGTSTSSPGSLSFTSGNKF